MVDGMYAVMNRINQIKSRFGLARRHNADGQGQLGNRANQNSNNIQQRNRPSLPNSPQITMRQPNANSIQGTAQQGNSTVQQQRMQLVQQNISSILQNNGVTGNGTNNGAMANQGFLRNLLEAVQRNEGNNSQ